MPCAADQAVRLFHVPGQADTCANHVLAQAGSVHAKLLTAAAVASGCVLLGKTQAPGAHGAGEDGTLATLIGYVKSHAAGSKSTAADKRRLLGHPHFVEALHVLAPCCAEMRAWDYAVAAGHQQPSTDAARGLALLGNAALAVRLRDNRTWCGEMLVATDSFGRLVFPLSDWSITLASVCDGVADVLADQTLRLVLDSRRARWYVADRGVPLFAMPRDDCLRLVVDGDPRLSADGIECFHPTVRPQLRLAAAVGDSPIRYDPVGFAAASPHADTTGAIVRAVVEAIRNNAPAMYAEMCAYLQTIRGFELPPSAFGHIQSFSTPTAPGVMGINVTYSSRDEPLLCPFCFTWFAHELAHTRHYLIDAWAFLHGWSFLANPDDWTDVVPRYGRRLQVRTVFQVPYVHLYEWVLLMDFCQTGFRGLPWQVVDDPRAMGDDLAAEIAESFDLIERFARLTPLGQHVMAHVRSLVEPVAQRWRVGETRIPISE